MTKRMTVTRLSSNHKYRLIDDVCFDAKIEGLSASNGYVTIEPNGMLYISKAFTFDGNSTGIDIDNEKNLFPSLIHDALYSLLRNGFLDESYKEVADDIYLKLLEKNGVSKAFVNASRLVLGRFGKFSIKKKETTVTMIVGEL